jgi:putative phosphonate metabolism protein
MEFKRYAIYFTPPPGPLADFGAAWLGWDPVQSKTVAHPQIDDLPRSISEITRTPRNYGFHATIKPPFRPKAKNTEQALRTALESFCATQSIIELEGLVVARLGRFLALRPDGDETALNAMAADTIRIFEPFRASLTAAELAKRRAQGLTPAQDDLLQTWGYPYVMEEFRFHITLTGKLPKSDGKALVPRLEGLLQPLLPRPFPIDGLALMGEDEAGDFHQICRHDFSDQGATGIRFDNGQTVP